MARIAVVGAGVGGLVAAIRLGRSGHDVTVYEKNDYVGGKLAGVTRDGFTFDTGPSLLTLPHVFGELGIEIPSVRLRQPFRYHFADGSVLDTFDDPDATADAFEKLTPGGVKQWKAMYDHGKRVWDVAQRTFFTGAMKPTSSLLRRMRTPLDLTQIDPLLTLAQRGERLFQDVRLRQWFNRYATYSGSSPWKAPATLSCIPYIEQRYGCWHISGGVATLADALAKTAGECGVEIRTNSDVQHLHAVNQVIHALTVNGERMKADAVVVNADADHLYQDLYPNRVRRARLARAGRSSSGFSLLLGVKRKSAQLAHHNVWFPHDQRGEFNEIFGPRGYAPEPAIYVCCSSITDQSQAPEGDENWFVLVNVAAGTKTDWDKYADRIVGRLGIENRTVFRELVTPQDLEDRFRAPGGAIYGTSSNGRRSAFLRADNRGPAKGLYLAGGSAHPGGGLPLVAISGTIAAQLIEHDKPWA